MALVPQPDEYLLYDILPVLMTVQIQLGKTIHFVPIGIINRLEGVLTPIYKILYDLPVKH